MRRHDTECALAVAAAAVRLVAHLLPDEGEQHEFFGRVFDAAKAALALRDEMIARERRRLGRPPQDEED